MYKPNFCSDCGEKIIRARWRIWTSRRFCLNCEGRLARARMLAPAIAAALLFSSGLAVGRATRPQPPPLIVQRGELPIAPAVETTVMRGEGAEGENVQRADSSSTPKPEPEYGPDGTATERPTDPNEVISICGARTQKGTPCQRRVRGTGRCWQHRGMPAILPQEKLMVTGK